MKRTSVQFSSTAFHTTNTESTNASDTVRKTSALVLTVGILLVIAVIVFISKHSEGLLLIGLVRSGLYPTDDSENPNHFGGIFFILSSLAGLIAWAFFC